MDDIDQAIAELMPQERRGKMLAGLLFGTLVGAATAAFLTSPSGDTTRESLRERGLELKDRAADLLRTWRSPL